MHKRHRKSPKIPPNDYINTHDINDSSGKIPKVVEKILQISPNTTINANKYTEIKNVQFEKC